MYPCRVLTRKSEVSLGGWSLRCIRSLVALFLFSQLILLFVCFTYCLVLPVSTTSFLAYLSLTMSPIFAGAVGIILPTICLHRTRRGSSESKTLDAANPNFL